MHLLATNCNCESDLGEAIWAKSFLHVCCAVYQSTGSLGMFL